MRQPPHDPLARARFLRSLLPGIREAVASTFRDSHGHHGQPSGPGVDPEVAGCYRDFRMLLDQGTRGNSRRFQRILDGVMWKRQQIRPQLHGTDHGPPPTDPEWEVLVSIAGLHIAFEHTEHAQCRELTAAEISCVVAVWALVMGTVADEVIVIDVVVAFLTGAWAPTEISRSERPWEPGQLAILTMVQSVYEAGLANLGRPGGRLGLPPLCIEMRDAPTEFQRRAHAGAVWTTSRFIQDDRPGMTMKSLGAWPWERRSLWWCVINAVLGPGRRANGGDDARPDGRPLGGEFHRTWIGLRLAEEPDMRARVGLEEIAICLSCCARINHPEAHHRPACTDWSQVVYTYRRSRIVVPASSLIPAGLGWHDVVRLFCVDPRCEIVRLRVRPTFPKGTPACRYCSTELGHHRTVWTRFPRPRSA